MGYQVGLAEVVEEGLRTINGRRWRDKKQSLARRPCRKGGQRNLIVELATALPDGNPLKTNALPGGFPFLIDDDTHEIVEPALLFLVDAYLTRTGFWNRNTAKRAAYDLLDWWRFLDHQGRPWDLADGRDLDAYRDSMIGQISPRTSRGVQDGDDPRAQNLGKTLLRVGAQKGFLQGEAAKRRRRFERSIYPPIGIHSLIFIPARAELRVDPGTPESRAGRVKRSAP